jgi:hypothetical protein
LAIAFATTPDETTTVVHIDCDLCNGDVANCPAPPYVFKKSWAQLILEAPSDLKQECSRLQYEGKRTGNHPEEYWSAYYSMEYGPNDGFHWRSQVTPRREG